jgi:predicted MPP superfamily phosphohydrolase
VGAALAGIYAFVIEPRWLELRRATVHLRDLPRSLEGLRIGVLTDLHAGGGGTSLGTVRRAAAMVMAERPDLIALTGDFAADRLRTFAGVFDALSALAAPLGVYAVPGNHDHKIGIERWRRELNEGTTFVDLTNRSTTLKVDGARLCIAGVDDLALGRPSLASLPRLQDRDFTILLAHNPDQAELARRALDRIDLMLCGHTHGGQVRIPGYGPILSSVERADLYEDGLRRRPWTQVYTSRGIGTVHIPARLFTRPEVSILELTATPRPSPRRGARRARKMAARSDALNRHR